MSVLAVPLYAVGSILDSMLPAPWKKALGGMELRNEVGVVWGGDIYIFAVSFFNAFVTAALVLVFFLLLRQLAHSVLASLLSATTLGLTTLVFAHSKNFFTHSLVALLLLGAILSLVRGVDSPRPRSWFVLGGSLAGAMLLTRYASVVTLPWLFLYVVFSRPGVDGRGDLRHRLKQAGAFAMPLVAAGLGVLWYNYLRFGSSFDPGYQRFGGLEMQLGTAVYGHLLSVGRSIFFYSPILLVSTPAFYLFYKKRPAETRAIAAIGISMLALYSLWFDWNGGWCFGNRFLLPMVPLLCIPLADAVAFLQRNKSSLLIALAGAAAVSGLVVQILGVMVNFSFVYHAQGFDDDIAGTYLFVPAQSQLPAHFQALVTGTHLDSWVYRCVTQLWPLSTMAMVAPWISCIVGGLWCFWSRRPRLGWGYEPDVSSQKSS